MWAHAITWHAPTVVSVAIMSRNVIISSGGRNYLAVYANGTAISTSASRLMTAITTKRKFGKGRLVSIKRIYQNPNYAGKWCVEICDEKENAVTARILSWNGYKANISVDLSGLVW